MREVEQPPPFCHLPWLLSFEPYSVTRHFLILKGRVSVPDHNVLKRTTNHPNFLENEWDFQISRLESLWCFSVGGDIPYLHNYTKGVLLSKSRV